MGTLPDLVGYDAGRTIAFGQQGQKQRTLADLGRLASQGDYRGAQAAAFAGGETELGLHLKTMNEADHARLIEDTARFAMSANTPEKWAAASADFQRTHPDFTPPPFEGRQALIDQAVPVAQALQMKATQAQAAQAQANSDRTYKLAVDNANTSNVPQGYRKTPTGNLEAIPGGPAAKPTYGDLPGVPANDQGIPDPQAQQAFLAKLDPGTAALVKGIADYQMDISKVTSLRADERKQLAEIVSQYDPTFDMTQYAARAAMRKSITSGTYSQALNSANLVIQHLDALSNAIDGLGNSDLVPWNVAKNKAAELAGSPAITKFNTAADAAAAELAKVFKGTGASSEEEIRTWRHNLDLNGSPAQIKQAIATAIGDLLKSRIDTIQNQYQAAMGKPATFTYLTPHSRQVLQDLGIDPSALDPSNSQGPTFGAPRPPGSGAPNAPAGGAPAGGGPQGGASIGDGATATGPNGQRIILRNGRWEPL